MTTGVDSKSPGTSAAGSANSVGAVSKNNSPEASERASLRDQVAAAPDAEAVQVEDRVVGDADAFEGAAPVSGSELTSVETAEVPSTEPSPENRAAANGFRDEFHAIDDLEGDVRVQAEAWAAGDYRSPNEMRSEVLGRVAEHAQGITDLEERNLFVRAVSTEAGYAAGQLSRSSPAAAYQSLDAIGQGVSTDTGRLLARSALQFGPAQDNLVPMGRGGSPVGDALVEVRQGRAERFGELLEGTARTVVPGVDAGAHLLEGNYGAAAGSLGVDLAGGAVIRGGRRLIGAVAGGLAMAPEEAQAGALSRMTLRFGDEAVEIQGRTGLVNGRTRTFDVEVPGRFLDGSTGTLRLADPRGKHNVLRGLPEGDLSRIARQVSRGRSSEFSAARNAAQFSDRYNSLEGQAELARLVMERITPADLARIGSQGGGHLIQLDRVVGLTPTRAGQVVPATSVRVMRNNDGAFHLVPMP